MYFNIIDLGVVPFKEAFYKQTEVHSKVLKGDSTHTLILCEHPHTITLGKLSKLSNILDFNFIKQNNIDFIVGVNRGGDITYHGPGQLMGYLIFDLKKLGRDLGGFLNKIEEALIRTVSSFGIKAQSKTGFRGTWIGERKIASIGIGIQKWVSLHGFGLNVNTDLEFFKIIKPCGLDIRMTSMQNELGFYIDSNVVKVRIAQELCRTFELSYDTFYKEQELVTIGR